MNTEKCYISVENATGNLAIICLTDRPMYIRKYEDSYVRALYKNLSITEIDEIEKILNKYNFKPEGECINYWVFKKNLNNSKIKVTKIDGIRYILFKNINEVIAFIEKYFKGQKRQIYRKFGD